MRWRPPSERVQFILLSPIVIPLAVVALPLFVLPLIVTSKLDEWRRVRNSARPRREWFAWRPVQFDGFWEDVPSQWLWLERVQCRWDRSGWSYLPLGFVSRYDEQVPQ